MDRCFRPHNWVMLDCHNWRAATDDLTNMDRRFRPHNSIMMDYCPTARIRRMKKIRPGCHAADPNLGDYTRRAPTARRRTSGFLRLGRLGLELLPLSFSLRSAGLYYYASSM